MKLKRFFLFVLASALLCGCAEDELPVAGGIFHAVMEDVQSKTSVTDEGVFTWSENDQIWLHTTHGSVAGVLSSGAGSSNADFTYGAYIGAMTGKALYPYNSGHSLSGNTMNVVLPSSYDLGDVNYYYGNTNTNAVMYGENIDGTLQFHHMAGVMRFVFYDVPWGVDRFVLTLDKKISGAFEVNIAQTYPLLETDGSNLDAERSVTLNFERGNSAISLYVPVPIGTYSSLELALYAGDELVWSYYNDVTNTVRRKTLLLMPSVTLGGSIGGEIEGDGTTSEYQNDDYIDEYGVNHGPGVEIDGVVWAPVNCGYHEEAFKCGKLYQFGRRYGQGYDLWYDTYHDWVLPDLEQGGVPMEVGNHIQNANKFYINQWSWIYPEGLLEMWCPTWEPLSKTCYDPCPMGWRLPKNTEFMGLIQNYSQWQLNDYEQPGYWFCGTNDYTLDCPQVFLPAAGYRRFYDGCCDGRLERGDYWCSGWPDDGYIPDELRLQFDSTSIGMIRAVDSDGCSVRCVKE